MATIRGTSGNDSLTGTAGDDLLQGLAGNDTLTGLAGNDTLDAGTGGDRLIGGTGNDTYIVDGPGDTVIENAGEGVDTVRTSAFRTLDANVENLTLTGTDAIDGIGNSLNNVITGNGASNTLVGNGGSDRLIGGAGNDIYYVDGSGDTVVENAGQGTDWVYSFATRTLDNNCENLLLLGTAAINGTGNSLNNQIQGNDANNVLNGGTGADALMGFGGDDTYVVDGPGDSVFEFAGDGTDTVQSSATRALEANVENLTLTGSAAINGTGNALDNTIVGNGAANTLVGGDGNDRLDGGSGVDTLNGGLGNDTYFVTSGDVLLDAGGVFDSVATPVSWTLGNGLEDLTALGSASIRLTGNNGANTIHGNSGNNVVDPRAGDDLVNTGAGNDTIRMSTGGTASYGNDRIDGWTGFDTVDFAAYAKSALVVDMTAGRVTGGGEGGSGSAALISIERVVGGAFSDRFIGSGAAESFDGHAGNDNISAGGGNDTIAGGSGNDILSGGDGNDRLQGRSGNDSLTGGAGIDHFTFLDAPSSGGVDRVNDFVRGTDELVFENAGFSGLGAAGAFAAGDGRFRAGAGLTRGQDSSDRLIYNTSTGSLYYDTDGSGSGGSILIATFPGNPPLAASDITVI